MKRHYFLVTAFVVVFLVLTVATWNAEAATPPEPQLPRPIEQPSGVTYELLMQLVSGALTATLVYKFLDSKAGKRLTAWLWWNLVNWTTGIEESEIKRYTALVLSGVVSFLAYLTAMQLGFVSAPVGVVAWVDLVLALFGVSFAGSQVFHARAKAQGKYTKWTQPPSPPSPALSPD